MYAGLCEYTDSRNKVVLKRINEGADMKEMKRVPVILDTDPGVDDFFAIVLMGAFDDIIDFKGITAMGGNNKTAVTSRNALDILHLIHRDDVPVYYGADSFLKEPFGAPVADHHGHNGIGDITIPHTDRTVEEIKAWDAIAREAECCDGNLVLVTIAPLTNIALTLQKYPGVKEKISKIVMMGGSTGKGNITPYAEANIGHDPYAADVVFASGIPVDMVGLNATIQAPVHRSLFDPLSEHTEKAVREALQGLIDFRKGEPMHDALAVSTLIDDSIITWKNFEGHVETQAAEKRGKVWLQETEEYKGLRCAMSVNLEKYHAVIAEMLKRYPEGKAYE